MRDEAGSPNSSCIFLLSSCPPHTHLVGSLGCHRKAVQAEWLQTAEMDPLPVLEARCPKSAGLLSLEAPGKDAPGPSPSPGGLRCPWACRWPSSLVSSHHLPFTPVHLCVLMSLVYKDTSHCIRAQPYDLILYMAA